MVPEQELRLLLEDDVPPTWQSWRSAMETSLYGAHGFFVSGDAPADHFRTSVHASPLFARAMLKLLQAVDDELGRPERLDLVDVGAGRGELLTTMLSLASESLRRRLRPVAVELAGRPASLDSSIEWHSEIPAGLAGLLIANEWLDNVPCDVVSLAEDGIRLVEVDPSGEERLGPLVDSATGKWLTAWWPLESIGDRAEVGITRDNAWADAVGRLERGTAVAIDYAHAVDDRPPQGTLTGYRSGRQVLPVPDGSCDITAHVALDACAAAAHASNTRLISQRDALRELGVSGTRPSLELARTDPAGYIRALSDSSAAAELTDPGGLGGFGWLIQSVG